METLNTLNFITKAKKIDINPKMNCQTKGGQENQKHISHLIEKLKNLENINKNLQEENENLKKKINNSGHDKINKMVKEKQNLTKQLSLLKSEMSQMKNVFKEKEYEYQKKIKKMSILIKKSKPKTVIKYNINSSFNYLQPKYNRKKKKNSRIESLSKSTHNNKPEIKSNKSIDLGTYTYFSNF